jgi:heat shock protein HtpX
VKPEEFGWTEFSWNRNGGGAMATTRYAPDRGLIARMGLTIFLLGVVFVAFILALVLILGASHRASGAAIVVIPVLLALGLGFGSYYWSDKIALRAAGAVLVTPQDGPQAAQLHGVVDRICALADMPKPRVAIAPSPMPNAFATGRNTKTAVICATSGLLDGRLNEQELEGVLAHEMSHVAHKDVAVMTIASFIGIAAALLVRFAFYGELFGGGGDRGRGGNSNDNSGLIMLAVIAVGVVVYAVSFLLIRVLSRYRELSADRSAALLTGQPSALASALQKVTGEMARIPTKDLRAAEPLNAFYFAPALASRGAGVSLSALFSTHPSLERRLNELAKISEQLAR